MITPKACILNEIEDVGQKFNTHIKISYLCVVVDTGVVVFIIFLTLYIHTTFRWLLCIVYTNFCLMMSFYGLFIAPKLAISHIIKKSAFAFLVEYRCFYL